MPQDWFASHAPKPAADQDWFAANARTAEPVSQLTPDVPRGTLSRVASGIGNAVVEGAKGVAQLSGIPGFLREGPIGAIKDQAGVVGSLLQAQFDQYKKAKAAQAEGRTSEMVGHSVATALPILGPMAGRWGEMIGGGEAPEAAGEIIAGALTPFAGKAPKALNTAMKARAATKAVKAGAAIEGDLLMAIPSQKTAAYTPNDLKAAKPYLNEQHAAKPITTARELVEAIDGAVGTIEEQIGGIVDQFPTARIQPDIIGAVTKKLSQSVRGSALEKGLAELSDLPITEAIDLPKAEALRRQLNAENTAIMRQNNWDRHTARQTNPAFAAREIAADELRGAIYGYLENRGVDGIRQLRRDEGSLLRFRRAADRHAFSGDRGVTGTEPSLGRRIAGELVEKGTTAAGAALAGPAGAVGGAQIGEQLGRLVKGGKKSRDEMVARAFSRPDDALPSYPVAPPQPQIAGLLPPAKERIAQFSEVNDSGPIPVTLPENIKNPPWKPVEVPKPAELPIAAKGPGWDEQGRPVGVVAEDMPDFGLPEKAVDPKVERSFVLRWLADDLAEMQYQPSSRMRGMAAMDEFEGRRFGDEATNYSPRVAGTPTQEMFHALGIKGTRAEISSKLDRALAGGKVTPQLEALADAFREAFDGQRLDFSLVSDETIARLGIRRRDLKSPLSSPGLDDMPTIREQFFNRKQEE